MASDKQRKNQAGREQNKERHPRVNPSPRPSPKQTSRTHGTERKGGGQPNK